ncbi:protease synthase and sporulation negative regulatory protein PAI 1 [Hypoxylon sp. EC38]|nr:protease synthase and sporulation negative regulatory protein PAI 1 [Hypoxylon sp. EC38]
MATAKVASMATTSQVPSKPTYEVIVGDALASDAAAIAQIGANTFTAAFGFSVPENDLADYLATTYSAKAIEAELLSAQENNISTFVARDEAGAVLGFVQLVRGLTEPCLQGDASTHAELRRLYVDVSAHGRGVGSKLIAAVENRAKAEGFRTLWLTVWEDNAGAQRLYRKLGYVKVGETDFATGECIQTDWVLAKSL